MVASVDSSVKQAQPYALNSADREGLRIVNGSCRKEDGAISSPVETQTVLHGFGARL